MLISLIGVMLAMLLLPMVIGQAKTTRQLSDRVRSLHAAEAGLEAALANIRAADDGSGNGSLADLPCGPLTGSVGDGGAARYSVTIDYLAQDPAGHPDSWVATNRIRCLSGGGAFTVPSFALLRADGTNEASGAMGSAATRHLRATYRFHTTNQQIPGGAIHGDQSGGSNNLCIDAGSSQPATGAALQMQDCQPGSDQQKWAYEKNLTLALVSSKTTAMPLGLCVDAGAAQTVGSAALLEPCGSTTQPYQQWSYNDDSKYAGSVAQSGGKFSCLGLPGGMLAGSFLKLVDCKDNSAKGGYAFRPVASVGAGAAGESTGQLVNFEQFGRCLDVTLWDPHHAFLIAWPCKQAPNPTDVTWNERWTLPADGVTGRVTVTYDNKGTPELYCLTSPAGSGTGAYVTLTLCPASLPATMKWTVARDTTTYATSYRIQDSDGDCVAPDPADLYTPGVSKVITDDCSASTLQKWNAPPSLLEPAFKDIGEH
jgi:hypothetical protein